MTKYNKTDVENVVNEETTPPRYSAPALDKGLDILELLASADSEIGYTLSQIGRLLSRSTTEIFRMVQTLEKRGYLYLDESDRYKLTLKLFELSHQYLPLRSFVSTALPLMRNCANKAKQSSHLTIYESGRLVIVASVDSPERWVFGLKVGVLVGLTDTASGLVMLAFSEPTERDRMLAAYVKLDGESKVNRMELAKKLSSIQELGYWQMESSQIRGVTNIAFPVFGQNKMIKGVVNIPFIERIDKIINPNLDESRDILSDTASKLSQLMGFNA